MFDKLCALSILLHLLLLRHGQLGLRNIFRKKIQCLHFYEPYHFIFMRLRYTDVIFLIYILIIFRVSRAHDVWNYLCTTCSFYFCFSRYQSRSFKKCKNCIIVISKNNILLSMHLPITRCDFKSHFCHVPPSRVIEVYPNSLVYMYV